jgi:hypothetical protein
MMIALVVLLAVVAVTVEGVTEMIQRKSVENSKVDLVQESREFMDLITNDMHQSGFPQARMFDATQLPATACPTGLGPQMNVGLTLSTGACPFNVAVGLGGNGLNSVTPTSLQFEADVDGTGVSEIFVQLVQNNGANAPACTTPPCVVQRGTISKSAWVGGGTPLYYTELSNVMNTNLFTAYDNTGTAVALPATTQSALATITDIGITLYVRASTPDMKTGQYPTATMISDVKIRLN